MSERKIHLAAEIGGTFTDIMSIAEEEGEKKIETLKVPSTPDSPEKAALSGFDQLDSKFESVTEVLHGSTVGTNAVLERNGVQTAFLVTEGFKDILEIQRGDKENIYNLFYQRTPHFVRRGDVFPVKERISSSGEVLTPIDEEQLSEIAEKISGREFEAVAICFLNSYQNTEHEEKAKNIIQEELTDKLVLLSSEVLPQFREYERASTTVMSAYIAPVMTSYIDKFQSELKQRGFKDRILVTQSNGGTLPTETIRKNCVRTLLSGPAAGVTGALHLSKQLNENNLITLDMGGTSTDVCLIKNGEPQITTENRLNGLPVAVPMIDIETIGAGGGSIAWLDEGGMFRVGPQSAGADPGPACYGKGGTAPTVTDAQVYKGIIRLDKFVGGSYSLDKEACENVIHDLSQKAQITPEECVETITNIVENNMAQAIRVVSTQRGYDPRNYTLVSFGGAGPMHAAHLAEELEMSKILIPRHAGIISAFGLQVADVIRDYVQTNIRDADKTSQEDLKKSIDELSEKARQEFEEFQIPWEEVIVNTSADLHYKGQAFELNIPFKPPIPDGSKLAKDFHEAHERRYGHSSPDEPVEIVNYRLRAVHKRKIGDLGFKPSKRKEIEKSEHEILLDGEYKTCNFIERKSLELGKIVRGPAVITEETSTCLIPEGWRAQVLENACLLLKREE